MFAQQIKFTTMPMACEIMAIDTHDRAITALAELLDSFDTLTGSQRSKINTELNTIAKTLRRIDDEVETLADRYNSADEERSELWDELQEIKHTRDYLQALVDVPHLENDLYTALKIARDSGSETAFMHISILEQVHYIVEKLSR